MGNGATNREQERQRIKARRLAATALEQVDAVEAKASVLEVTLENARRDLKTTQFEAMKLRQVRDELKAELDEANARTMSAMCETDGWIERACRAEELCHKWRRAAVLVAVCWAIAMIGWLWGAL